MIQLLNTDFSINNCKHKNVLISAAFPIIVNVDCLNLFNFMISKFLHHKCTPQNWNSIKYNCIALYELKIKQITLYKRFSLSNCPFLRFHEILGFTYLTLTQVDPGQIFSRISGPFSFSLMASCRSSSEKG